MSGRRRGERSQETSSSTTAPLEHGTPPNTDKPHRTTPVLQNLCPQDPENKEQPLNVGTFLISTAPDSHRTPEHALTVPPKSRA